MESHFSNLENIDGYFSGTMHIKDINGDMFVVEFGYDIDAGKLNFWNCKALRVGSKAMIYEPYNIGELCDRFGNLLHDDKLLYPLRCYPCLIDEQNLIAILATGRGRDTPPMVRFFMPSQPQNNIPNTRPPQSLEKHQGEKNFPYNANHLRILIAPSHFSLDNASAMG